MQIATLGIILEGNTTFLAEKKKGEIGTGVLSSPGGKLDPGETLVSCLIRETKEEWNIELHEKGIEFAAVLDCFAGGVLDFRVFVYRVRGFDGILSETKDAKMPEAFPIDELPFNRMFEADRHWFTKALSGPAFYARLYYRERAQHFERIEFPSFEEALLTL